MKSKRLPHIYISLMFFAVICTSQNCQPQWKKIKNKESKGGQKMDNVRSEKQCQQSCFSNRICLAVDFHVNDKTCYLHTNIKYMRSMSAVKDVSQLRLVRICQGNSGNNLRMAVPKASSIPSTTGSAETTTSVSTTDKCDYTWKNHTAQFSDGGTLIEEAHTLDNCLISCRSNPECLAADFSKTNECYLHTVKEYYENTTYGNFSADQYVIKRCACEDYYKNFTNKSSEGGILREEATTLNDCLTLCQKDLECVGVDYYTTSNQCFVHLDRDDWFFTNYKHPGVNQYRIERCRKEAGIEKRNKLITPSPISPSHQNLSHKL